MRFRNLTTVSLCAVGMACGGGESGGEWAGTITDSAGIQIVDNPSVGLWETGSAWQLTEELRIGNSEGDVDYQFGQIVGITVGETNEIFVLDQQAAQVRVFDAAGVFQRTIGAPGGGPGELGAAASALIHVQGDTLSVADMANMRVQHFLEDGTPAGNYRIDMTKGMPVRWLETPEGVAVAQVRQGMLDTAQVEHMDAIVSMTTTGGVIDTLLQVPAGQTFSMAGGSPEFNFFSPEPVWTLAPGNGIWYGVSNRYDIGLYNENGALVRRLRKATELRPVGEQDKTIMVNTLKRTFEQMGLPPEAIQQISSIMHFADNLPAFMQIFSGPQSTLWVQQIQVPSELTEEEQENFNPLLSLGSPVWDVFDTDGRFLGPIEMPARFQPLRFRGNRIYGVWRDDLDVQYVMALSVGGSGDRGSVDIGG